MIDLNIIKNFAYTKYNSINLHMPYIYYINNNPIFLFDIKINNTWKIFKYQNNKIEKVNTFSADLNNNCNQCNPFVIKQHNKYKFGYTYNNKNTDQFIYKLYNCNQHIIQLNEQISIKDLHIYFLNNLYNFTMTYDTNKFCMNNKIYAFDNNYSMMCIRPIFNSNNIIFTLCDKDLNFINKVISIIFYPENNQFKLIMLNNGNSVYKCSIDPITEDLYYAKHIGNDFQDRTIQVVTKNQYKLLLTNKIYCEN